ncbi:hypothetical protein LCGC14_0698580 [marine sediment metagenome]|uniref:Uncharacterized protein n=1 Tax=marine sediment metagenome TaxID=412755 RepID=A0A0F9QNA0_9ZZZZ
MVVDRWERCCDDCLGWFESMDGQGVIQIERCDKCARFEDDSGACEFAGAHYRDLIRAADALVSAFLPLVLGEDCCGAAQVQTWGKLRAQILIGRGIDTYTDD